MQGGVIIASNHNSHIDSLILGYCAPRELHFIVGKHHYERPILGFFLRHLNSYPVHGQRANRGVLKYILQLLQRGEVVVIYPEGSRSKDGTIQPLKDGAALLAIRANCPIIPTYIKGTFSIWPRHTLFPRLKGKVVVTFGNPIYPLSIHGEGEKKVRTLLTEELKKAFNLLTN